MFNWINKFMQHSEPHTANPAKYRAHPMGIKRSIDWQKLGSIFALFVGGIAVLMFLFLQFSPAILAWRDQALAPFQTHPLEGASGSIGKSSTDRPADPVGVLTAGQINAIDSWAQFQKSNLGMDTFEWRLVRGPDPITRNYHVSMNVRVSWHQSASVLTQDRVCRLTLKALQAYRDQSWTVINAVPGTLCDSRVIQ